MSSYSKAVVIGQGLVIIGERINPTGKSKFKQALREHDLNYILREGAAQQDNGAHILDVNVGLPEIDEPSMMEEVMKELQSILICPFRLIRQISGQWNGECGFTTESLCSIR